MIARARRLLSAAYANRWDVLAFAGFAACVSGLWWERPSVAMIVGGLAMWALSVWRDWANTRRGK